jgi:hypothetical protein
MLDAGKANFFSIKTEYHTTLKFVQTGEQNLQDSGERIQPVLATMTFQGALCPWEELVSCWERGGIGGGSVQLTSRKFLIVFCISFLAPRRFRRLGVLGVESSRLTSISCLK